MEKDRKLFMNEHTWNSCNFSMDIQSNDNSFFMPNWENSMDQSDPFESALSSIVTSPAASNASVIPPPPATAGDNVMIRELIGRIGNICNSGEMSSQSYLQQSHNSTKTVCYCSPLNSPPKLHLSVMDSQIRANFPIPGLAADPGFAERAARLSCFGTRNGLREIEMSHKLINRPESGKLSRVSSTPSKKVAAGSHQENNKSDGNSGSDKKFISTRPSKSSTPENGELGDSKEEPSVSEQIPASQNEINGRKRKSIPRGKSKAKETTPPSSSPSINDTKFVSETEESNSKRTKQDENDGNQKQNKDNSKSPKDYIHVRARRGQATDSHSLAERARREKISERMKFLQDLVPGCNKVTGKAVMLDEIINYVQSLQRQVEFLSMKLATVNPKMDFNMEALLSKDMYQSRGSVYQIPIDSSTQPLFPFGYQEQAGIPLTADTKLFSIYNNTPLNSSLHRKQNLQLPHPTFNGGGFTETSSQVPPLWEDDLQSLVQMGFNQNQTQSFNGGSIATAQPQMKIEM